MTFAQGGSASVHCQRVLAWPVAVPEGAVAGSCFALVCGIRYCVSPRLLHAHSPSPILPTCAGIFWALRGEVVACEPRAEPLWEAVASAGAGKVPWPVALGGESANTLESVGCLGGGPKAAMGAKSRTGAPMGGLGSRWACGGPVPVKGCW